MLEIGAPKGAPYGAKRIAKSLSTPQIVDFRVATGNMPVGIVRPEQYGGSYWLE